MTTYSNTANRLKNIESLNNNYCALRHGRSLANEANIISSHPNIATKIHGLSEVGQSQAIKAGKSLVEYFSRHNFEGVVILTSDYLRAKETAEHVAKAVVSSNLPLWNNNIILEERLRERWFGDWDGGKDCHYPDVWKEDAKNPEHTLQGVESVNSVMRRTTDCILSWDEKFVNHLILLVAHGDVLQITQAAFLNIDGSKHREIEHLETASLRPLQLMTS
jgi:glucosyl-3-phosphoglycerate phosphatase